MKTRLAIIRAIDQVNCLLNRQDLSISEKREILTSYSSLKKSLWQFTMRTNEGELSEKQTTQDRINALEQLLDSVSKEERWDYFKEYGWAGRNLRELLDELKDEHERMP